MKQSWTNILQTFKKNKPAMAMSVIVLFFFSWVAVNSHGYYHPDEHFQLIEFAGLKLGWNETSDLAWEYNEQIRPTIQVVIATAVIGSLQSLGMENPYQIGIVLRLLSAILSLLCFLFLLRYLLPTLKNKQTWLLLFIAALGFWFMPYVTGRFSSEAWSGMLLLPIIAWSLNKELFQKHALGLGLLLGFSFYFRFQMAFAFAGWVLWVLLILKPGKSFWKCVLGVAIAAAVSTLSDFWFYENWVFTPWQYFKQNIINDVAASFGTSPWYFYFEGFMKGPGRIAGPFIIFSFIYFLIKKPKSQLMWLIIPFIVCHSLIGHKELRFMFPLVFLIPVIFAEVFTEIWMSSNRKLVLKSIVGLLLAGLFISNTIGLVMVANKPGGLGRVEVSRYIHEHYPEEPVMLHAVRLSNPYHPYRPLVANFYVQDNVAWTDYNSLREMRNAKLSKDTAHLFAYRVVDADPWAYADTFNLEMNLELNTQALPDYVYEHRAIFNFFWDLRNIKLYSVKSEESSAKP